MTDERQEWITVAGLVGATMGVAAKTVQTWWSDRARRDISQRDLWAKIQNMERRIDNMSVQLHESREEASSLRVQITKLEAENRKLREDMKDLQTRYDALKIEHDKLTGGMNGKA